MSSLALAIKSLYPGSEYAIEGDSIDRITWFKNKPDDFIFTDDEAGLAKKQQLRETLKNETYRLAAIEESLEYQRLRRPEYPPLADLADALYWQAQGDNTKMNKYLAAVDTVKTKYPKGLE
jgi:hypothetical protein